MKNTEKNLNIVNVSDLENIEMKNGEKFHHKRKDLTSVFTDNKIVAGIYEIPPGKINWPYHYHCSNEEVFYILKGEGELRLNGEFSKVKAGDFIRFKVGSEGAHQLKNTGSESLVYIDIGTANEPDMTFYPDSNKVGLFAGSAPGQSKENNYLFKFLDLNADIGYWENE